MRYLISSLVLLASFSAVAAEDGLISVPKDMVAPKEKPREVTNNVTPAGLNPYGNVGGPEYLGVNDNGSQKSYEDLFLNYITEKKKDQMMHWAKDIFIRNGVKCFPDSSELSKFGFQRVSEFDYKMNCYAGDVRNGDRVTDVAEFRVHINIPNPCPNEAEIKKYFSNAGNRTRAKAQELYATRMRGCPIQVFAANSAQPVVGITPVKEEFAKKRDEPREAKSPASRGLSSDQPEEEESRPRVRCSSDNPFCQNRGAN